MEAKTDCAHYAANVRGVRHMLTVAFWPEREEMKLRTLSKNRGGRGGRGGMRHRCPWSQGERRSGEAQCDEWDERFEEMQGRTSYVVTEA
jgi:hypothetical protein